jgi:hypothetical protein
VLPRAFPQAYRLRSHFHGAGHVATAGPASRIQRRKTYFVDFVHTYFRFCRLAATYPKPIKNLSKTYPKPIFYPKAIQNLFKTYPKPILNLSKTYNRLCAHRVQKRSATPSIQKLF